MDLSLRKIGNTVVVGFASLWAILKGIYVTLRPPKVSDPGEELFQLLAAAVDVTDGKYPSRHSGIS